VVQGALKLVLEPIFEADFQTGKYGYRPKRSPKDALRRVSEAILLRKTYVIDLDLRAYFDSVRHNVLLEKAAKRINDDDVMHLRGKADAAASAANKEADCAATRTQRNISRLSVTACPRGSRKD
jgi:retron-type reverse transcriptase